MPFLITHPSAGVLLANEDGQTYWSGINPDGLHLAKTFSTKQAAADLIQTWIEPSPAIQIQAVSIAVEEDVGYATETECVEIGVAAWRAPEDPAALFLASIN